MAEELLAPGFDADLDCLAVWDGEEMTGYVQVGVADSLRDGLARGSIMGGVLPDFRRQGLGGRLMDFAEARVVELSTNLHPHAALSVDLHANLDVANSDVLAHARGYLPVRYFQQMGLQLEHLEPAMLSLPDAETAPMIRTYSPQFTDGVRGAHNEAFADHWGSTSHSTSRWNTYTSARSFRPGFGRLLVEPSSDGDPLGRVLSYVLSSEWVPGELYVDLVGTRRAARGKGYAAVLLSEVLRAAAAAGYRRVELQVDSESPTGAVGLYERLGFGRIRTMVVHQRIFPATAA
ncbi:ribosomal protein S18 acetylase RimI-like enzyme [Paeniglutamicibacter cryotolerans]|uniref:Ribosomal protein S18 acetylase RimI-like enzyme n=1 Tax=Paeniglutamicibacter cryotolerans TaxID=670079 RepID=A0A839QSC7_9MICC|nr:GNAT family N-acetyltransferase [Paeniglutamicibacter cryotolerans]MBB2994951.1 ribosomal protein S18 acetylase RimI-like enzyme [Paeniglutamicibacter cryotolerans]